MKLTQNCVCFKSGTPSLCSSFHHSWIHPKVLKLLDLLQCVAAYLQSALTSVSLETQSLYSGKFHSSFFFFWASCSNHCLAALGLGAGVEQPFGCLIVQHRQAMQSMGRLMDWTLEDNMVDSLFFCATLTGRRGGHTPFVQAGAETSDTGAEAVKPDPGSTWEGGCRCRG